MRVFVGSYLDAEAQQRCRGVIAALVAASQGRLRSIPEDTAHLTCAFLASLPDAGLPTLETRVGELAAAARPLDVAVGPPVVQYTGREARLVHLPVITGGNAFAALAETLTEVIARVLPDVAVTVTRSPHVTLARFRRGTRRRDARDVEACIARDLAGVRLETRITSVRIVESQLTPTGALYVVRATARLGR